MKIQEIPVLLLIGYLGSDRITLVGRILPGTKGIKFVVIVSGIDKANIDASLIKQGGVVGQKDDSLMVLQNGCICYTLKLDLVQQLSDIVGMGKFDYIVIEASGIREPVPITRTIYAYLELYPQLAGNGIVKLDFIMTVVDALRLRDEFGGGNNLLKENIGEDDLERLAIERVGFYSTIIVNRTVEITPEELTKVKKIIRVLQPKTSILGCNHGDVGLGLITGTGQSNFDEVATLTSWIAELEGEHDEDEHRHHHHHDHPGDIENKESGEALEYNIQTFVYYRRPIVDLGLFDDSVVRHWPKNAIHCKGICYFNDEKNKCYVFEQAGRRVQIRSAGQWHITISADQLEQMKAQAPTLRRNWDETHDDRTQKLVFTGQSLGQEATTRELDACLYD